VRASLPDGTKSNRDAKSECAPIWWKVIELTKVP
jgi:hypothetical protein